MLDEIRAYEECTCDLTKNKACRLNADVLKSKNHLNGLVGAMTIIARYELDSRGYFCGDAHNQTEIIEEVKKCLRQWVGFADDSDCDVSYYKDWFKEFYIDKVLPLDQSDDKSEIKPWDRIVVDKKKQFEASLITTDEVNENSYIQITYERIIADAIYLGPLKKYYLVFKKQAFDSLQYNGKRIDLSKKKAKEKMDGTLKLIAAYLLKKNYTGNQFNIINSADLANWAQCYSIFKDKNDYFKTITYGKACIFENRTVTKNISKIAINQDFLEDFDFKIVTEDGLANISEEYMVCVDGGSGVSLLPEDL